MDVFLTLLLKLLPLYGIIFLGYIAGKWLGVKKESIASLLIYIIVPVVILNGAFTVELTPGVLSLPILFLMVASVLCIIFYSLGKLIWAGSEKNILGFAAGDGNTGYFGLPLVLLLLGDQFLGIAVLCTLGFMIYENSVGFFVTARGNFSAKEAFIKVLQLPTLYAFLLGVLLNIFRVPLPSPLLDVFINFRGGYTVLGMMLVGVGLSQVTEASFDALFTGMAFLARFVAWPLVMALIIFLDLTYFHVYGASIYKIMLLMAVVPLASNTVAYATKLNTQPEKAAVTVFLSTLFSVVYIPLVVSLVFPLLQFLGQ